MPITIGPSEADYLSHLDGSGAVTLHRLPRKTQRLGVPTQMLHFDGIAFPRAFFGEYEDEQWQVSYRVVPDDDGDQWAALRALLESREVLVWHDTLGNATHCAVSEIEQEPEVTNPTYYTDIRFSLNRVEYP